MMCLRAITVMLAVATAAAAGDLAALQSHDVPATMPAGSIHTVHITYYNSGTTTWPAGGLYRLGAGSTATGNAHNNDFTWSNFADGGYSNSPTDQRAYLGTTTAPGASATFTFDVTAPTIPGTYHFEARMVHDGVGWFGGVLSLTVTVTESNLSPPGWLSTGWNMVSIPIHPDDPAVESVLSDLIDAGNLLDNALFRYNGTYEVYPADFDTMGPGVGYWLNVSNPTGIEVPGDEPTAPFEIPLRYGWNLIGYPFKGSVDYWHWKVSNGTTTVSWQDATSGGWVDGLVFAYVPGTGYVTVGPGGEHDAMEGWKAYWLLAKSAGLRLIVEEQPPGIFVRTQGTDFYLDGQIMRFVGFNVRGLAHYGEGDVLPYSQTSDRQTNLGAMRDMGARVARIFVSAYTADPVETGDRLEECLSVAQTNDVYLIVAFTDQYKSNLFPQGDGVYYTWNSGGYQMLGAEFYASGYQVNYLPEVEYIVSRFKNNPYIFAWEVGNELKYPYNPSGYIAMNHAVADAIRAIDSNHLITTGTGGRSYAGLSTSDYIDLYDGYFDFLTVHAYNGSDSNDDSAIASSLNMPFIVEEAGFSDGYADRPAHTDSDIAKWVGRGARGYMQWGLMATGYDNGDGDRTFGMDHVFHTDWDDYFAVYSYWADAIQP